MSDPVLFELHVKIRVCKAALPPVLMDDDVTFSRREIAMELAAPTSLGERMPQHDSLLSRIDEMPGLVVPQLPLAMRNNENTNTDGTYDGIDGAQVRQKADRFRDLLETRPHEAALGQEVVVGINDQQRGTLSGIFVWCHGHSTGCRCDPTQSGGGRPAKCVSLETCRE